MFPRTDSRGAKKIGRVCRDWASSKGGSMSLYIIDTAREFVHTAYYNFFTNSGGTPIVVDGQMIGAIGGWRRRALTAPPSGFFTRLTSLR